MPTRCRPTGPPAVESARSAELYYAVDDHPGVTRHRAGQGFTYKSPTGRPVRDARTLARINALVIPPAWTHVWVAPSAQGHLQATGRDARGRKQYRYHPRWTAVRDEVKYERMVAFGKALPAIRRRTRADLKAPPLSRGRVLATVVRLLEKTLIRVGNDEYAKSNGSFGLTTLRDRHVTVRGPRVTFRFRAKSGVLQAVDLADETIARSVKACQDLPGQTLFQYLDDKGERCSVDSGHVNAYLKEVTGREFTAKDFRTWAGTVLAACALSDLSIVDSVTARKKNIVAAVESVARRLGNTRAVCRRCYVHPAVFDAYLDGTTIAVLSARAEEMFARHLTRLSREETAVLALLGRRLALARAA
ncbi:MAG: DNA topoisomerase IB [Vicinamibacterales bacterium]